MLDKLKLKNIFISFQTDEQYERSQITVFAFRHRRTFYHGAKADLKPGDMLRGGYSSNYTEGRYRGSGARRRLSSVTLGRQVFSSRSELVLHTSIQ